MTTIEWTDETWNPTTGCNKVSPGCKHCYAEKQHKRMMHMHPKKYTKAFSAGVQTHDDELTKPLQWKKPRRIFVNSMSDLFHDDVAFQFIEHVFMVMAGAPQHTFQILTKRPERMIEFFSTLKKTHHHFREIPLPNVWLGVSCENQQTADERIPLLLQTPAAVRFLSCEPLLGKIDLMEVTYEGQLYNPLIGIGDLWPSRNGGKIHWVICGGESGSKARPMHPDWARSLRDQCKAAGVPFFFKQWGEWIAGDQRHMEFLDFENVQCKTWEENKKWSYRIGKKAAGRKLDGVEHNDYPTTQKLPVA